MTDTSTEQAKEQGRGKFYFWRIVLACWAVVAFCGGAAWVVSTYFY